MSEHDRTNGLEVSIYVASKACHGARWVALRDLGFPICCTWIDEAGEGDTADWGDLWVRCIAEAANADVVVAVHHPGEEWKGAFVEIGAALAHGRRVIVVGDPPGSWRSHPLVSSAENVPTAFVAARSLGPWPYDHLRFAHAPGCECGFCRTRVAEVKA